MTIDPLTTPEIPLDGDRFQQLLRERAPPPRSLIRKVSEIMGEVSRVAKNGRNDFHKYDYATESDIAEAVRSGMATRGLALFPSVEKTEFSQLETGKGGKLRLATLTVRFTLEDSESGETRSFTIIGEGSDSGDKATYKAMTGAEKYALMKLFLIPTGDDPERETEVPGRLTGRPGAFEASDAGSNPAPEVVRDRLAGRTAASEAANGGSTPSPGAKLPFDMGASKKGDPISTMNDPDLNKLGAYALKSVNNPEKAKYKRSNAEILASVQAEQQRRQGKSQTFQADPLESDIPF